MSSADTGARETTSSPLEARREEARVNALVRRWKLITRGLGRSQALKVEAGSGWRFDLATRTVTFPPKALAEHSEDDSLASLGHEIGHALYSRLPEEPLENRSFHLLWNAVEDTRVNRMLGEQLPGLERLLHQTHGKLLDPAARAALMRQHQTVLSRAKQMAFAILYEAHSGGQRDPLATDPDVVRAMDQARRAIARAARLPRGVDLRVEEAPEALILAEARRSFAVVKAEIWPIYQRLLELDLEKPLPPPKKPSDTRKDGEESAPSDAPPGGKGSADGADDDGGGPGESKEAGDPGEGGQGGTARDQSNPAGAGDEPAGSTSGQGGGEQSASPEEGARDGSQATCEAATSGAERGEEEAAGGAGDERWHEISDLERGDGAAGDGQEREDGAPSAAKAATAEKRGQEVRALKHRDDATGDGFEQSDADALRGAQASGPRAAQGEDEEDGAGARADQPAALRRADPAGEPAGGGDQEAGVGREQGEGGGDSWELPPDPLATDRSAKAGENGAADREARKEELRRSITEAAERLARRITHASGAASGASWDSRPAESSCALQAPDPELPAPELVELLRGLDQALEQHRLSALAASRWAQLKQEQKQEIDHLRRVIEASFLRATRRRRYVRDYTKAGKYDHQRAVRAALVEEATGKRDPRVYRRRGPPTRSEWGVILVVDRSCSMAGPKLEAAKRCYVTFTEALDSLNIANAALAYHGEVDVLTRPSGRRSREEQEASLDRFQMVAINNEVAALDVAQSLIGQTGAARHLVVFITDTYSAAGCRERVERLQKETGARVLAMDLSYVGLRPGQAPAQRPEAEGPPPFPVAVPVRRPEELARSFALALAAEAEVGFSG